MHTHTKLLTPREVAARFALHPHTVSRALCGAITIDLPMAFKVGGQWRFREDDVDAHIDKLSGRGPAVNGQQQPLPAAPERRKAGRPRKQPISGSKEGGAA